MARRGAPGSTARVDDDRGVFMISVAAELAEMHPQTLRMYEARGLIEPKRSPKGTRLYSQDDVERLRRIQEMTAELGMNLAGVERVFELEDKLERPAAQVDALERRAERCRTRWRAARGGRRSVRAEIVRYEAPGTALIPIRHVKRRARGTAPAMAREDRAAVRRPGQQCGLGERLGERRARCPGRGGDHAGPG